MGWYEIINISCFTAATWIVRCAAVLASAFSFSIPLRQNLENICIGQENFLLFAGVDNCVHYYQCYAGHAYLMECTGATWFNEEEQVRRGSNLEVSCWRYLPTDYQSKDKDILNQTGGQCVWRKRKMLSLNFRSLRNVTWQY